MPKTKDKKKNDPLKKFRKFREKENSPSACRERIVENGLGKRFQLEMKWTIF